MKLNMGCGHNKRAGYINVDMSPVCNPDVVCDLEAFPWPWEDNSVDGVLFNHSLEHIGQDSRVFLGMMKELYRICRGGAEIEINVPHPRHDHFITDPTHVRIITPGTLRLFDRAENDEWKRIGAANSPLAHYLDVDFQLIKYNLILDEPYATQFNNGELSEDTIRVMGRELNNIYTEFRIVMIARKSSQARRAPG